MVYNGGLTSTFGSGELNKSDSIFVGYTLDTSEIANYWLATYTLTDVTTGEIFTNSYKW
jgi:hypothetical protein